MTTVPAAERILITGASRGIGQRMAVELARPGRTLILVARTQKALTNTVSSVRREGRHRLLDGVPPRKAGSPRPDARNH